MEYLLLSLLIVIAIVSYLSHRRDRKLLCSVSFPTRGTRAERKLIVKMWKKGAFESNLLWFVCEEKSGAMFEHFSVENMAYVRLIMMPSLKVQELLIVAILSTLCWMRFWMHWILHMLTNLVMEDGLCHILVGSVRKMYLYNLLYLHILLKTFLLQVTTKRN